MTENVHTSPAQPSRRTLLATLGLGGLPPTTAGAEASTTATGRAKPGSERAVRPASRAGGAGTDAEPIRLGAALEANEAALKAYCARWAAVLDEPQHQARLDAMFAASTDMAERLADMRATTVAGLRAKARAMQAVAPVNLKDDGRWGP